MRKGYADAGSFLCLMVEGTNGRENKHICEEISIKTNISTGSKQVPGP